MPLSQKARQLLDRAGASRPPASIELRNFKAYGEIGSGPIPIKPITLVFGQNSAGKSSLLHSLLWLDHGITTGEWDVHHPRLSGDMVDLGGFEHFVHKREDERTIMISLEMNGRGLPSGLNLTIGIGKVAEDIDSDPEAIEQDPLSRWERRRFSDLGVPQDSIGLRTYEISYRGETAIRFARRATDLRLDVLMLKQDLFEHLVDLPKETARDCNQQALDEAATSLMEKIPLRTRAKTLLNVGILPSMHLGNRSRMQTADRLAVAELSLLEDGIFQAISRLTRLAATNLGSKNGPKDSINTVYLGPIRIYPDRDLSMVKEYDRGDWCSSGLFAWELLKELPIVRDRLNKIFKHTLEVDYEFQITNRSLTPEEASAVFDRQITEYFESMQKEGQSEEGRCDELDPLSVADELSDNFTDLIQKAASENQSGLLRLVDAKTGTPLAAKDVGMGISQVIPILVATSALSSKMICMEQPELHLHPGLQAKLADALFESAISKDNKLIIETHSEHLILRLLRRVRETTEGDFSEWPEALKAACPNGIRPEDIAVLYVQPGNEGAEIIELPVTPDGDFSRPWPSGFFTERDNELF
jgi:hypothetical protein